MEEKLINTHLSKADFARFAGVRPPSVSVLCKGQLAPAVSGGKIDISAPCVVAYLERHRRRGTAPVPKPRAARIPTSKIDAGRPEPIPTDTISPLSDLVIDEVKRIFPSAHTPEQIRMIASLTVQQVAEQFTNASGASEYVTTVKKLEDTRMVQLKIAEKEGELIPRELVKTTIIGMLDALHIRLLRDAPRTITSRCYALAKNGAPMEDAEAMIHGIISQHLKGYVATAKRILLAKIPVEPDVR